MAGTALDDVSHFWGQDLQLSPTGDLARVSGADRSQQRVLRRLLTNPTEYLWHPLYGGGLPRQVGLNVDIAKATALIRGQMLLEASVSRVPAPTVSVSVIDGGLAAQVQYLALPDKQPVSLSFNLSI